MSRKPVVCPKCGHEILLKPGWFGGTGGLFGGMRMMPSNSLIRCPACGHLFALPKDAPLALRPVALVVGGAILALALLVLMVVFLGWQ